MEGCSKFRRLTSPAEHSPTLQMQPLAAALLLAAMLPPLTPAPLCLDEWHGLGIREVTSRPWRTSDPTSPDKPSSSVFAKPRTPAPQGALLDGASTQLW